MDDMSSIGGEVESGSVSCSESIEQNDEAIVGSLCTCPLCRKELPDGFILVKQDCLDRFSICQRCGYAWEKGPNSPKRCPECGSFKWSTLPVQNVCFRCGHQWRSRFDTKPIKCPECQSRNWFKPGDQVLREEIAAKLNRIREASSNDCLDEEEIRMARAMPVAILKCLDGESILESAYETQVPILDLILCLESEGVEIRIR